MTSGDDTVWITSARVPAALVSFLNEFVSNRPELMISISGPVETPYQPWHSYGGSLPEDRADVEVVTDPGMIEFWEENAYSLRDDGLGPVFIMYERAPWQELLATVLEDPYSSPGPAKFRPYDVGLIGASFYMVTVVTPDVESDFSKQILKDIKRHLVAAAG